MSRRLEPKGYQKDVITTVGRSKDLRLIVAMTGSGKSLIAQHILGDRKALVLTYANVVPQLKQYFPKSLVTSYNKFCMDKYLHGVLRDWIEPGDKVLILDEVQRVKCATSKSSKILRKLKSYFVDIYMLSACPAPNGLEEYFMASFLSNQALGENYEKFLLEHTKLIRGKEVMPNTGYNRKTYLARGFKQVVTNRENLLEKIKTFTIHVPDHEVLSDMPTQEFNDYQYELAPTQRRHYKEVLEKEILTLKDRSVPLKSKLTVLTKLQQIESGFFYDEDKNVHVLSGSKFKALYELLESIGDKRCILFTQFVYERNKILDDLLGQATDDAEEFKAGRFKYLVGHPKSIGVGVSLEIAHYCIFVSHSFSFEDRLQSEGRILRISQDAGKVIYYNLVPSERSITHYILDVLKSKGDLHELVKEVSST